MIQADEGTSGAAASARPTYEELLARVAQAETQQQHFAALVARMQEREAALLEREEGLRLALVAGGMATWDWHVPSGEVTWNEEHFRMLGYEPGSILPGHAAWAERVHPEDRAATEELVHANLARGGEYRAEYRVLLPDGTVRWIEARGRTERDAAGKPLRHYGVLLDITERRKTEEVLRRYELLVGNSRDIVLFMRSEDGRILEANAAAQSAYGYSHEEMLALSIHDLRAPDTTSLTREQMAVADAGGILFEAVHRRRDGSTFPVEVSSRGATMDETRTLMSVVRDITERKRAEAALLEAHRRTASVLASIADAFYSLDDDWRFVVVNPAAERAPFGRPASELLGKVIWDLYPDLVGTSIHRRYLDAVQKRSPEHYEAMSPLVGRWYEVFMFPREGGLDVYMRDVDLRKKAEEAFKASELRFRLALRNAPVSVAAQDRALQYIWAFNQRTAPPEGIVGKLDRDIFTAEEATRITAIKRRVLDEGIELREQMWLDRPSGRIFLDVCWEPLRDEGGRVIGVASATVDLTPTKLAEEALRESKAKLDSALASMTDAVFISDGDGRFVDFNDAFATFHRFPNREECAKTLGEYPELLEVFLPDGTLAPLDQWAVPRALRGETVTNVEYTLRRKDTGETWVGSYSFAPIRNAQGAIVGSVVVGRDITEAKRAEQALRESEATLRGILNATKESVWLFATNGVTLMGNETALARWGRAADSIIGRPIDEILTEDLARTRLARLQQAARSGPLEFEDCRDGIHFEHRFYPVRGANGQVDRVAAFSRDVTDRKAQERRIRQLSRLYAVLSKVNESIVRVRDPVELHREVCRIIAEDGDRPLVWIGLVEGSAVKPVAWSGPASAYLEGLRVDVDGEYGRGPSGTSIREDRIVLSDDFDSNASVVAWRGKALRHGLRASASFPLRHQGAVIGSLTLYGREPGTFDAEQVGLLDSLCADVSHALDTMGQERALRESERSLREADQRKNEFLGVLSHELRNPLTPIRNSLYILDRATPGGEQARRAHAIIDRQVGHLARLVDDLLDVTRITRAKIRLQRERVDFVDLVARAIEDHRSLLEEHEVAVALPSEAIWIDGDPTRLAQVLGNLLGNAAKFTPTHGKVSVSLTQTQGRAVLEVADTGMGIDGATLERLFEPFAQADRSIDRSRGGLGLGLALVKGMVELHGGEVSAHSDGPGKGARFTIRLPIDAVGAMTHGADPAKEAAGNSRAILIIEDNRDAADTLSEALELFGHRVAVAYDGEAGLVKAREFRPEAVLCDIGLPRMDGYAVARAFRADDVLKSAFLVALSGYALSEDVQRAHEAGFQRHLAKPASVEKLRELLANLPASDGGPRERSGLDEGDSGRAGDLRGSWS
jgi:two-component system CheB/CheR fusion protein